MTSLPPKDAASASPTDAVSSSQKVRNFLIVIAAVVLSLLLGISFQSQSTQPTLTALAESATPLEIATTNGKPSLVEFYANWCTSCQAMVGDMTALKAEYGDRVNFVMLNVDNNKWLPEVMRYGVEGIPHFIFLDRAGGKVATAIGEQPRTILSRNLDALVADASLPSLSSQGQTSTFEPQVSGKAEDPRAHSSFVAPAPTDT